MPQPPNVPGPDYSAHYLASPPGPVVSRDEAFSRALGAMYWGGYWTAVYHVRLRTTFLNLCSINVQCQSAAHKEVAESDEEEESSDQFVSTQR